MATYRVVIHSYLIVEIARMITLWFPKIFLLLFSMTVGLCYGKNRVRPLTVGIAYNC